MWTRCGRGTISTRLLAGNQGGEEVWRWYDGPAIGEDILPVLGGRRMTDDSGMPDELNIEVTNE